MLFCLLLNVQASITFSHGFAESETRHLYRQVFPQRLLPQKNTTCLSLSLLHTQEHKNVLQDIHMTNVALKTCHPLSVAYVNPPFHSKTSSFFSQCELVASPASEAGKKQAAGESAGPSVYSLTT